VPISFAVCCLAHVSAFVCLLISDTMADNEDAKEEVKAIDEGAVAAATATMKEEVQSLVSRCDHCIDRSPLLSYHCHAYLSNVVMLLLMLTNSTAYLRAVQRAVHEPPNTKSDATKV
jgi:hypothetical protein